MTGHNTNAEPTRVLVVDDEPDLCTLYELTLLREGHDVTTAANLAHARQQLATQTFDVLITDMRLPDGMGLELLQEISTSGRRERSIVITAYGSADNAVEALKAGAFDYLTKPVELEQFRNAVRAAASTTATASEIAPSNKTSTTVVDEPTVPKPAPIVQAPVGAQDSTPGTAALDRLVGESAIMRALKAQIAKVAPSMAPVLVHGESGTGKELVARAIHACSHRHNGPFVAVNCGAIPENLLEAEFFGARKGAYTGANQDRIGFFQAAAGGTLFLDEIGDLPLVMQVKLLRAIQERCIRPLGATREENIDVRFVSATHRNLAQEVAQKRFRQDLYYRLAVIEITVAPLRERREDIPAISLALLERIAQDSELPKVQLAPEHLAQIAAAPLHGNVRELENLLYRAVALGKIATAPAPLPSAAPAPETSTVETPSATRTPTSTPTSEPIDHPSSPQTWQHWLDHQEKTLLGTMLQDNAFNLDATAQRLHLSVHQLKLRLQRLNMEIPSPT